MRQSLPSGKISEVRAGACVPEQQGPRGRRRRAAKEAAQQEEDSGGRGRGNSGRCEVRLFTPAADAGSCGLPKIRGGKRQIANGKPSPPATQSILQLYNLRT